MKPTALRLARLRAGLTMQQVVDALRGRGIAPASLATLHKWERGHSQPRADAARALTRILKEIR